MDLSKFAELHFSHWNWTQLIGAGAVTGLSLLATTYLLDRPYASIEARESAAAGEVRHKAIDRWRHVREHREFVPYAPMGDDHPYGIAWIYGSEADIYPAPPEYQLDGKNHYQLTQVLARYSPETEGRPVVVHEFRESGVRSGDLRRAVLYTANAPEIDAIIMPLNPLWLFNDYVLFNPSTRRATLFDYPGLKPIDYAVAAAVIRPSEIVGEWLDRLSPFFRYRYEIHKDVYPPAAIPFMARSAKVHSSTDMVLLWLQLWFPPEYIADTSDELSLDRRLRAAMLMTSLSEDAMGARLFKADLETLAASGKPVVLYMEPLNPSVREDAVLVARLEQFATVVKKMVANAPSGRIVIDTDTMFNAKQPYAHRDKDLYHMRYGQGPLDMLVGLLERASGRSFARTDPSTIYGQPSSETPAQ